jgi:hypothetical protein
VEVLRPGHFFLDKGWALEQELAVTEEDRWEIFQGRLLHRAHTRQRRTLVAWSVFLRKDGVRSGEPLLSLKLDERAGELHVVRGVEAYVHEGFDAGGGVIETRERRRWIRELTGTVRLAEFTSVAELRDELAGRLFRAVVGASRLPLHSIDAPLVEFSFGKLFYRFRTNIAPDTEPLRTYAELAESMRSGWTEVEFAKVLETCLHASDVSNVADRFANRWTALGRSATDLARLLRTLFNEVSLTPWTDVSRRTLAYLAAWEERGILGADQVTDFLSHLLRQTSRHLTAYDLETFHHRGANYPDALVLDDVLKAYLVRINREPAAFLPAVGDDKHVARRKLLRRRALRQGWLLRRRYEGHPVPDAPTSPGEYARVLPPEHPRVPEEQILQPAKRKMRLFAYDPICDYLGKEGSIVLQHSVDIDVRVGEVRELGMALYLDRPFGDAKEPTAPDATLLLATEAFSASVAIERLRFLANEGLLRERDHQEWKDSLRGEFAPRGVPLSAIGLPPRPSMVALTDARMKASDFVFKSLVPGGIGALLAMFDFSELRRNFDLGLITGSLEIGRDINPGGPSAYLPVVVARTTNNSIGIYSGSYQKRLELVIAPGGYTSRAGVEWPTNGLLAVEVVEILPDDIRIHDLRQSPIRVPSRRPLST